MNTHGLILDVYTAPLYRGCGGISKDHGRVTLLDDRITPPGVVLHEPTDAAPAVLFRVHRGFRGEPILTVIPAAPRPEGTAGPMFGGGFVYSRDERFGAILAEHGLTHAPVPFHDHYERGHGPKVG